MKRQSLKKKPDEKDINKPEIEQGDWDFGEE